MHTYRKLFFFFLFLKEKYLTHLNVLHIMIYSEQKQGYLTNCICDSYNYFSSNEISNSNF